MLKFAVIILKIWKTLCECAKCVCGRTLWNEIKFWKCFGFIFVKCESFTDYEIIPTS